MTLRSMPLVYCDVQSPGCDYPDNEPLQGESRTSATQLAKDAGFVFLPGGKHECQGCLRHRLLQAGRVLCRVCRGAVWRNRDGTVASHPAPGQRRTERCPGSRQVPLGEPT